MTMKGLSLSAARLSFAVLCAQEGYRVSVASFRIARRIPYRLLRLLSMTILFRLLGATLTTSNDQHPGQKSQNG
jgi:hypothetical protein